MNRLDVSNVISFNWTASVNSSEVLLSLPSTVTGLIVSENSCNDLTELNLSRFEMLKSFEVKPNTLRNVKNLKMNGLNGLVEFEVGNGGLNGVETVSIGSNSLNSLSSFDFSPLSSVRVIEIGSESMNSVVDVIASQLNLENVRIEDESLKNTTK